MNTLCDEALDIIGFLGHDIPRFALVSRHWNAWIERFYRSYSLDRHRGYCCELKRQIRRREALRVSLPFNTSEKELLRTIRAACSNAQLIHPPLFIFEMNQHSYYHGMVDHFVATRQRHRLFLLAKKCVQNPTRRHRSILRRLFDSYLVHRTNRESNGQTLLFSCDSTTVAAMLLDARDPVNVNHQDDRGSTALRYIVCRRKVSMARYLLDRGADPAVGKRWFPVHECQSLPMMRLIFPRTLDRCPRLNLPKLLLHMLPCKRQQACCHWLLDHWAKMKHRRRSYYRCPVTGHTALHRILRPEMFRRLQRFKPTTDILEARDNNRRTPLMSAAMDWKRWCVVPTLLVAGANANARWTDGTTALHMLFRRPVATDQGVGRTLNRRKNDQRRRIIQCLLQHHADINAQDEEGRSVLHYCRDEATIRTLIYWGANPLVRDINRRTLLYYCGSRLMCEIILCRAGSAAFISARDRDGTTALEHALSQQRTSVVKCLIENGATMKDRCFVRWCCVDPYRLVALEHAIAVGRYFPSREDLFWLAHYASTDNQPTRLLSYAMEHRLLNVIDCMEDGMVETIDHMGDALRCLRRRRNML